jgi:hypothetical protein
MKTKSAGGLSTQKRTSKVSIAMVGFFDILGFSDRVEKVQTEADLLEIAATVGKIRKHFEYRPKEDHVRKLHHVLGKRVLAFSDCIITAVSIHTDFAREQGLFDTLGSEILEMAYSQIRSIWQGYFLRGGVDIGYWHYSKDLLVSPALVTAYKEEQRRACYPVIAISNRLYALLRNDPGRKCYSKDADPLPDQFSSFQHPDGGRVRFLNYLRLMAKSVDWQYDRATYEGYMAAPPESDERSKIMSDGYQRNLVAFFVRHKELIVSAFTAADEKVKAKYRFLADYHNREARLFLRKRRDIQIVF